jgi:hypothetical protein
VPHIHVPQAGQTVDVLAAVDVIGDGSPTASPDDRVGVIGGMVERVNEVGAIERDEFGSGPSR